MKNQKPKKETTISRRGILPILGSTLLIPFLGFSNSIKNCSINADEEEEYKTLLKSDGSTVKVKSTVLKDSKIVKKNVSNRNLLKWLRK